MELIYLPLSLNSHILSLSSNIINNINNYNSVKFLEDEIKNTIKTMKLEDKVSIAKALQTKLYNKLRYYLLILLNMKVYITILDKLIINKKEFKKPKKPYIEKNSNVLINCLQDLKENDFTINLQDVYTSFKEKSHFLKRYVETNFERNDFPSDFEITTNEFNQKMVGITNALNRYLKNTTSSETKIEKRKTNIERRKGITDVTIRNNDFILELEDFSKSLQEKLNYFRKQILSFKTNEEDLFKRKYSYTFKIFENLLDVFSYLNELLNKIKFMVIVAKNRKETVERMIYSQSDLSEEKRESHTWQIDLIKEFENIYNNCETNKKMFEILEYGIDNLVLIDISILGQEIGEKVIYSLHSLENKMIDISKLILGDLENILDKINYFLTNQEGVKKDTLSTKIGEILKN
jgi:hypothetical protein